MRQGNDLAIIRGRSANARISERNPTGIRAGTRPALPSGNDLAIIRGRSANARLSERKPTGIRSGTKRALPSAKDLAIISCRSANARLSERKPTGIRSGTRRALASANDLAIIRGRSANARLSERDPTGICSGTRQALASAYDLAIIEAEAPMPDFQNETPPEFAPAPGEPSLRPPPEPTYTDDQAKAILERAVRIAAENPITREDLVRAAAELDISAEVVDRAEKNLYTNSSNEALRQIYRLKQTARYQKRLVTAVEVTVIFMVIWFFSGRGYFWPGWIIPWVYLELFTTFPTAILKNSAIYKEREDRFVAKAIGAKKAGRSEN